MHPILLSAPVGGSVYSYYGFAVAMTCIATVLLAWAIIATYWNFRRPIPVPDRGHRVFGVADKNAWKLVVDILDHFKIHENFSFKSGPSYQTLMMDGATVIHYLDEMTRARTGAIPTALSIRTDDPQKTSDWIVGRLKAQGFLALATDGIVNSLPKNHLIVVSSDAFVWWVLVVTRPLFKMGKIERKKLTDFFE